MFDPLDSPATFAAAVTPSNSTLMTTLTGGPLPRALYIGSGGDVAVTIATSSSGTSLTFANVTFVGVPTGAVLPIRPTKVLSTGTGASSIVALW